MPESLVQAFEIQLAEAGVEPGAPTMCRTVKEMRKQLTSGDSGRQQVAKYKPRLGAHLTCCKHFGKPGTPALFCMQRLRGQFFGIGLFGLF
jgi:hypothetical protein